MRAVMICVRYGDLGLLAPYKIPSSRSIPECLLFTRLSA